MPVTVFPCDTAVNESEVLATEHLEQKLQTVVGALHRGVKGLARVDGAMLLTQPASKLPLENIARGPTT